MIGSRGASGAAGWAWGRAALLGAGIAAGAILAIGFGSIGPAPGHGTASSPTPSLAGDAAVSLPPTTLLQWTDTIPVPELGPACPDRTIMEPADVAAHPFYFTRAAYTSGFGRGRFGRAGSWTTDFPKSDRQFLFVVSRLLDLGAFPCENPVRLDDPRLARFPFLYMVEPGRDMQLTPPEVEGLREYLLKGGFLHVDDFWGTQEWRNFEREMRRVLPEHEIVEIPMDHPVFHIGFRVDEVLQVPSIGNARRGVYHERDGYVPHVLGIFDEHDRLMVVITWNSDLGDAWEWAENPDYPRDRSNFAFKMGANFILYALTH